MIWHDKWMSQRSAKSLKENSMFVPTLLAESRAAVLWDLIRQNPLGALVVGGANQLNANHLPFESVPTANVIRTHISRANELVSSSNANALVIFQGPNHYISPSWQPGHEKHGRVAPSWNYAVAHIYGRVRLIDEQDWLLSHLDALAEPHESMRSNPWQVASAPPDFVDGLIKRIIGIEIQVERMIGKSQACQQYNDATRDGVVAGLLAEGTSNAALMADVVRGAVKSKT
ncbi:FMN-binding negative transcriptional regulator [Bradyrhizobium sp. AUGA SZCCT0182]|uniref:FMN-binding negative transcriptional regulator n=1 Tax=Bradyrhizobium sp. AUGA SZCCT0182 TaxID=2807667 RepID=UPI00201316F6|nr:FMN-binding negative transcriptional regulator [Bradyrhizobium sp. AUGA SZCCT0182]